MLARVSIWVQIALPFSESAFSAVLFLNFKVFVNKTSIRYINRVTLIHVHICVLAVSTIPLGDPAKVLNYNFPTKMVEISLPEGHHIKTMRNHFK